MSAVSRSFLFHMPQTKEQKKKVVKDLKEKIDRQKLVIFFDFTGLKVKDLSDLRKKLKGDKGELKVAKKTLMSIAFQELNPALAKDLKKLSGEIALAFGYQDAISCAKTLWRFAKDFPSLKILGGLVENNFREASEIIALAELPSKEELIARLFYSVKSPLAAINNLLQRNLGILKVRS